MAQMPVEIIDLRRKKSDALLYAIKCLNEIQIEYRFSVLGGEYSAELEFAVRRDTNGEEFFEALHGSRLKSFGYHPFIVALMDSPISNSGVTNLFSIDAARDGYAMFTTHNVAETLMPSETVYSYVTFQLAFFALKFSGGDIPFHVESRRCLFDYREYKTEIVDAIRFGEICDQCKRDLAKAKISPGQIDAVRKILAFSQDEYVNPGGSRPMKNTKIFIASSVEGLEVARAIQSELDHDFATEIWNQSDVFRLGSAPIEALESALEQYDFGIFVFTPDDQIESRGQVKRVARDNVIFEAGLFIGKHGRYRSFLVVPRGVEIQVPSDLQNLTTAAYDPTRANLASAVGPACEKIRKSVKDAIRANP